jgi:hypothetical protein
MIALAQRLIGIVADDQDARMQWKHYWRNIVNRYKVMIEGWPEKIPIANFSDVSTALPDLEMLLRQWRSGKTYWRKLSNDELQALNRDRDEQIENGEIEVPAARRPRSDRGKKRPRSKKTDDNGDGNQRKKRRIAKRKHASHPIIESDEDEDEDDADDNQRKKRRIAKRKHTSLPIIESDEDEDEDEGEGNNQHDGEDSSSA